MLSSEESGRARMRCIGRIQLVRRSVRLPDLVRPERLRDRLAGHGCRWGGGLLGNVGLGGSVDAHCEGRGRGSDGGHLTAAATQASSARRSETVGLPWVMVMMTIRQWLGGLICGNWSRCEGAVRRPSSSSSHWTAAILS